MLKDAFKRYRYDTQRMYLYALERIIRDLVKQETGEWVTRKLTDEFMESILDNDEALDKMLIILEGEDNYKDSIKGVITWALNKYYKIKRNKKSQEKIWSFSYHSKIKTDYVDNLEDMVKLIRACKIKEEELILRLFLQSGIRRSIIIQIKPSDIKTHTIRVSGDYIGNKMKQTYEVPIFSESFKNLLKDYIKNIPQDKPIFEEYLSRNCAKGFENKRKFLTNKIAEIGKRVNLNIRPHMLRHTFGSWYYMKTKDIELIRYHLGHASYDSTRRYVNVAKTLEQIVLGNEERKKEVDKILDFMFKD